MSKRVVVIGGGSAGVGAAYRAAHLGGDVTVIESSLFLGGTSTLGGVNCWEPGIASFGLNRTLYQRMRNIPYGASVGKTLHPYTSDSHIGLNGVDFDLPYEITLKRSDLEWDKMARVHFEPGVMARCMADVLNEVGVTISTSSAFIAVKSEGERITGVYVRDLITGEEYLLPCDVLIDATADAVVFKQLGLPTRFGEDGFDDFNEPSAPEKSSSIVNGVSLCFRVSKGDLGNEAPIWTHNTEASEWISKGNLPCSNVDAYPNGDLNFNPLPIMQGNEYFSLNPYQRHKLLTARVYLYWEWMKREHGHKGYHISEIFPRVGVRESWRCVTLDTTTEHDLRRGCFSQGDDIIALADHMLDTHGQRSKEMHLSATVKVPYGVKIGSLISGVYSNLLVAGRCAGFSHIAASSCRLTRTMMDMGEAAGALAVLGDDLRTPCTAAVRQALGFERYLEWTAREYPRIGI